MSATGSQVTLQVVRLVHSEGIELPQYQTPGSAGMDLRAAMPDTLEILPGGRAVVPTGLTIAIPLGFEAQVRPRSGLAIRNGILVLNSPGTIDSDYRGEVQVILANFGQEPFVIRRGDRVAQLVVCPIARVDWQEVAELPSSVRGSGGFGHTGR